MLACTPCQTAQVKPWLSAARNPLGCMWLFQLLGTKCFTHRWPRPHCAVHDGCLRCRVAPSTRPACRVWCRHSWGHSDTNQRCWQRCWQVGWGLCVNEEAGYVCMHVLFRCGSGCMYAACWACGGRPPQLARCPQAPVGRPPPYAGGFNTFWGGGAGGGGGHAVSGLARQQKRGIDMWESCGSFGEKRKG